MPLITAVGELSYNGYTFDGATHVTISTEFVTDDADRTVIYHKITLMAKTVVANDNTTDNTIESIRARLGESGKPLTFIQQGFGDDLVINPVGGGGLRDIKWGPKPQVLEWEPIGSCRACEVVWKCVTCIPMCADRTARNIGVLALNYSVDYTIDQRGYTTRTISGYLEIAQTRNGANLQDNCDAYRERITPTVPIGFKRQQNWTSSLDKSRLDFTIVDTEIPTPNAFPPSVVDISGRHRVRWQRGRDGGFLRNTINLDVEMAADAPPALAYAIFVTLARLRINQAIANTQGVLIDELGVDENLFGRDSSFIVGYRITSPLDELLGDSGLWQPLGGGWAAWHASMATAHDQRGFAGLRLLNANDAIIDACTNQQSLSWNPQQAELGAVAPPPGVATLKNTLPDPKYSWLRYRTYVFTGRHRPVARQAVLQTKDSDVSSYNQNDTNGPNYGAKSGIDDILQQGGRSRYTHTLIGSAMRVGYPIPRPVLTQVGSSLAVEVDGQFVQTLQANALGVPIYSANWSITYDLENSPSLVKPTANVKEIIDINGNAQQPN